MKWTSSYSVLPPQEASDLTLWIGSDDFHLGRTSFLPTVKYEIISPFLDVQPTCQFVEHSFSVKQSLAGDSP
jgi:hypothetical protein